MRAPASGDGTEGTRPLRLATPAVVVALMLVVGWFGGLPVLGESTRIVIVRHAEQLEPGSENPNLSPAGLARAEALAAVLADARVGALYAADLCRSAQTLLPLARAAELSIHVRRFASPDEDLLSDCRPPIDRPIKPIGDEVRDWAGLARFVQERQRGETVVIVGHTTTIPTLLETLLDERPPSASVDLDEYDDLFVVDLPEPPGDPSLVHARYGSTGGSWRADD